MWYNAACGIGYYSYTDCVLYLNAISKPTFFLTLNWRHKRLCIPHRTLWRYTNVVLVLVLVYFFSGLAVKGSTYYRILSYTHRVLYSATQGMETYPPSPVTHSEWVYGMPCHRLPLSWSCRCWWVGCIYGWLGLGDPPAIIMRRASSGRYWPIIVIVIASSGRWELMHAGCWCCCT